MNIWQLALVVATILVVGYFGFGAFTKSIQALGPEIEAAILKRGEERIVIMKNEGVSVRNSTGYIWEETVELEPGCTLISLVEEIVRYYNARGNLNEPPSRADWLWVEMTRSTDELHQDHRVLVVRIAEFPKGVPLRRSAPGTFEAALPPSGGNGDHAHEPVLAGSTAGGTDLGNSTC